MEEVSQVFLLKYSWFIMLCKFQVYSTVSQILNLAPCANIGGPCCLSILYTVVCNC